MKMTVFIGTPYITQPNLVGEVVGETPTLRTIEVREVDFTPKTGKSGRMTHRFSEGEREYLTDIFVGQVRRFHKESGKEVGGLFFLY